MSGTIDTYDMVNENLSDDTVFHEKYIHHSTFLIKNKPMCKNKDCTRLPISERGYCPDHEE